MMPEEAVRCSMLSLKKPRKFPASPMTTSMNAQPSPVSSPSQVASNTVTAS